MKRIVLTAVLLLISAPAFAYVGPGAGISVLGSILGILATLLLAIAAVIFWPVRRLLKRRKAAEMTEEPEAPAPGE